MARSFFGIPSGELTNSVIPLSTISSAVRRANSNAACAIPVPHRKPRALLTASLQAPANAPNAVQHTIAAFADTHGLADLDLFSRAANLSPRQFRRRCLEESGLTPKHLCRILRFRRALNLGSRHIRDWAGIAAETRLLRPGASHPRLPRIHRPDAHGRFFQSRSPVRPRNIAAMKITPVLFVKKVEESLRFWVDRIGFEKTVEVPGEDGLAFVILVHEGAELMLQSIASVLQDAPPIRAQRTSRRRFAVPRSSGFRRYPETSRRLPRRGSGTHKPITA